MAHLSNKQSTIFAISILIFVSIADAKWATHYFGGTSTRGFDAKTGSLGTRTNDGTMPVLGKPQRTMIKRKEVFRTTKEIVGGVEVTYQEKVDFKTPDMDEPLPRQGKGEKSFSMRNVAKTNKHGMPIVEGGKKLLDKPYEDWSGQKHTTFGRGGLIRKPTYPNDDVIVLHDNCFKCLRRYCGEDTDKIPVNPPPGQLPRPPRKYDEGKGDRLGALPATSRYCCKREIQNFHRREINCIRFGHLGSAAYDLCIKHKSNWNICVNLVLEDLCIGCDRTNGGTGAPLDLDKSVPPVPHHGTIVRPVPNKRTPPFFGNYTASHAIVRHLELVSFSPYYYASHFVAQCFSPSTSPVHKQRQGSVAECMVSKAQQLYLKTYNISLGSAHYSVVGSRTQAPYPLINDLNPNKPIEVAPDPGRLLREPKPPLEAQGPMPRRSSKPGEPRVHGFEELKLFP